MTGHRYYFCNYCKSAIDTAKYPHLISDYIDKVPCPNCNEEHALTEIDDPIALDIEMFNKKGWETISSCCGKNFYNGDGTTTLMPFQVTFYLPERWNSTDWFYRFVNITDYLDLTAGMLYDESTLSKKDMRVRVCIHTSNTVMKFLSKKENQRHCSAIFAECRDSFHYIVTNLPDLTKAIPFINPDGSLKKG